MIIKTFSLGPIATNAILIGCDTTKKAALIDPAMGSYEKTVETIDELNLTFEKIFLTHSHWDHIADVAKLKQHFACQVYVHQEDAENLLHPGFDGLPMMFPIDGVKADEYLEEQKQYSIGTITFSVLHTPGHSPGSVCFYFAKEKLLLSGDTLFKGSIGNLSFPSSSEDRMWPSLKKLAKLPKDTTVIPGHGDRTTIKDEPWLDSAKSYFGY